MTIGGGNLGPAGQRSVEHTGEASEVRTPWHIFKMSCVVEGIKTGVVVLALYVLLGTGVAIREAATGSSFWPSLWAGLQGAFRVIRWVMFLPVLWWLSRVWHHATLLVHHRWEPEQLDPYAHQPYEARDPSTRGRTFWDDYGRWLDEPEPTREPTQIPPVNVMDDQGVWHKKDGPPVPEVNGDWKLVTFLRSVMSRARPFSRRGAMANGLYTRAEWEKLENWATGLGFHKKGTGDLTSKGKRWATGTIERMVQDNGKHSPAPVRARDNGQ